MGFPNPDLSNVYCHSFAVSLTLVQYTLLCPYFWCQVIFHQIRQQQINWDKQTNNSGAICDNLLCLPWQPTPLNEGKGDWN